ncbi:MAG TPA: lysylphosphatidylglycerol synthase transmembrane domain-containing protein [Burkholderiales bacterium]|nr:lysylphosphatidylglycerol synthase transmembrane domain-containing protein [Burkholderiales bacterium]
MKTAGRVGLGLVLLAAVVWYADPRALARELAAIDVRWFAAAVVASVVSNVFSAARWAAIARGLGLHAPLAPLVRMYFRGMTMNVLLPGATVSGDLLRGYQLAQLLNNPLLRSGLSVLLDRLSGLWILCAASLVSLLAALAAGLVPAEKQIWLYCAGLLAALALPWVPLPVTRAENARRQALQGGGPILRSVWLSVLVQLFSAAALWLCGFAAGVPLSYPVMLAAAAPIFIMGAMPLGWGGFGARELSAVVVLGALGVAPEQATVTGLLYGISAVLQGILAAPLFVLGERAET